ncbi:MAG: TonB family protein [Sphingomonas sp.]|uniref:TonB family protein n=1 Tax=Sphingomonas sp. TaxID=28214 RepID=UPI003F822A83
MPILLAVLLQSAAQSATPPSVPTPSNAPASTPATAPVDPVVAAAAANRARMKVPPHFVSGPKADLPDSERALGHHGVIKVSGVIDVDGHFIAARVAKPSGAPVLDKLALDTAAASTFKPATDAEGQAIPVVVSMPVDLVAYKSSLPGGGLVHYGCRQFVLDMDWWRRAHPDTKWQDHELYTMLIGLDTLVALREKGAGDVQGVLGAAKGFEAHWLDAIEQCRKQPDKLLVDVMRPEGEYARQFSKLR